MRLLRPPRIFISYAREDHALAKVIRDALVARRLDVFFDSDAMLAGEDFVERLVGELRRSDAVIALLTPASAGSEWCQAEWYFAHARGVQVIPIRAGDVEPLLPSPIRLLEQRIHYLDPASPAVGEELARQLDGVRRAARWRAARRIAAGVAIAVVLVAGIAFIAKRVESFQRARDRRVLLQRIGEAKEPLSAQELAQRAAPLAADDLLLGETLRLSADTYATDASRLSALMLSTELLRQRKPEQRWVIRNASWRNGALDGGRVPDVTFATGLVERLTVRNSTLASVYWLAAPAPNREGMTLSASSFRNVKFNSGGFAGTNAINVDFLDCVFRGAELDVSNFALVTFRTSPPDPDKPNLITGQVGAFENSVILDRNPPPAPGVMDLSEPRDEVRFEGIVFTGVRFRGRIRPQWFKDCSFDRCTFPTALPLAELERRGNRIYGSTLADEPLD